MRLDFDMDILKAIIKASQVAFDDDKARIGLIALYTEILELL